MPASNSAADSGLVRDAFSRLKAFVNSHASRHAVGGADPLTPASIGAVNGVAIQPPGGWADMDANLQIQAGRYALYAGTSKNVPSAGGGVVGILEVLPRLEGAATQIYQRWIVMGSTSGNPIGEWIRGTYDSGSTWGSWVRVDNADLKPSDIGAADLWAISRTGAGEDANTFTTAGMYMLNANAANTPVASVGYLEVTARNQAGAYYYLQEFTQSTASSNSASANRWLRHSLTGATWSSWTRVGIEDTYWRNITSLMSPAAGVVGGSVLIRRIGNTVAMRLSGIRTDVQATGNTQLFTASGGYPLPNGFLASSAHIGGIASQSNSINMIAHVSVWSSSNVLIGQRPGTTMWWNGAQLSCEITWITDQAWPTTLPGTPA